MTANPSQPTPGDEAARVREITRELRMHTTERTGEYGDGWNAAIEHLVTGLDNRIHALAVPPGGPPLDNDKRSSGPSFDHSTLTRRFWSPDMGPCMCDHCKLLEGRYPVRAAPSGGDSNA